MRKINIEDKVFGDLKILKELPSVKGKSRWLALCVCGKQVEGRGSDFKRKDTKALRSCGCRKYRNGLDSPHWKGEYGISARYYKALKASATRRNKEFSVSYKDLSDVFMRQEGLCVYTGKPILLNSTASVDRLVNSLGYTKGNIQWVHKRVNKFKSDIEEEEFLELVKQIYKWKIK